MLISEGSKIKSNKSRKPLNFPWLIQKCTKTWVFSRQRVSSCMVNQVPEKHFLPKQLPAKPLQLSWESSALNLFKSTWETVQNSSDNFSKQLNKTHLPSFSLMKSMPSVPRDTIPTLEAKNKFKEPCFNCWTNWTVSILMLKLKSSWLPTKYKAWIQPWSDLDVLIEKLNSQSPTSKQNTKSSKSTLPEWVSKKMF